MKSEFLKLKRTLVPPVVLLTPLVPAVLVAGVFWGPRGEGLEWSLFMNQVQVYWALLMLPLVVSLLVAQLLALEHASGSWRPLLALPRRRARTYLEKAGVLLILTAVMNVLALLAALAAAALLPQELQGILQLSQVLWQYLFIWLAGFAMLFITLWVAVRFPSFLAPSGAGAAATVVGFVLVNSERYGPWWPWNLAAYSVMDGSLQGQVLAYSLTLGALMLVAGLIDFGRRDL